MKTLDLIFFGLKGKINGPKALKELESLGVIKGNKIVYDCLLYTSDAADEL